jgi:UDP-N-acetylmuramoylalanine--D-glutamate ligase
MSFDLKTQIQPPVIIVGLARSGLAAYKLLLASGFQEKDILTFDERKPEAQIKSEAELEKLTHIKTAVISPGVPLKKNFIEKWRKQGVHITSEITLALSQVNDEKIIGITGSLGKSTTTSLIGAGIQCFDANTFVGGNLGIPFCEYALTVKTNPALRAKWIVLELSSYQLENADKLQLDYSMITFLSPNHLERYDSLNDYYETKWSILERTKTKMVLNENGGDLKSFALSRPSPKIRWSITLDPQLKKLELTKAALIGQHNQDNLAMAAVLGLECGFPDSYFQAIKKFGGLKHRMENLGRKRNALFINDSKATTIDSVKAAISATKESFPDVVIYLLLGGRDKKLPWQELQYLSTDTLIRPLFFGEHGSIIKQTLRSKGPEFKTLKALLEYLSKEVFNTPTVVLFSPGGVSQDEFASFEDRGDHFRFWYNRLSNS